MKNIYNVLILLILLIIAFLLYRNVKAPGVVEQQESTATTTQSLDMKQVLPTSCVQDPNGNSTPVVITEVSPYTVQIGGVLTVKGCNFSGFEGDLHLLVEHMQTGEKGVLYAKPGSTASMMMFDIPNQACHEDNSYSGNPCSGYLQFTPGEIYKIYTNPWGNMSNTVMIKVI